VEPKRRGRKGKEKEKTPRKGGGRGRAWWLTVRLHYWRHAILTHVTQSRSKGGGGGKKVERKGGERLVPSNFLYPIMLSIF